MRPETSHTVATEVDGRQISPSAERNKAPMLEVLKERLGTSGTFLELASGTGEHIAYFARNLTDWHFQPTEADENRLGSIRAWTGHEGVANVAAPRLLDGTTDWGATTKVDVIHIANVFHLITEDQATSIITQCAKALNTGGQLMIYGPFMRDGKLTSEGDARFHANIQAADPERGYKNDRQMLNWLQAQGLTPQAPIQMPANNLYLIATNES